MVELEIFLGTEIWNQSWLLNTVDIASETEKFSGIIISESLEKVDAKTIRCIFTLAAQIPKTPAETPSVITSNTDHYPNIKRLCPSAGTSWPIPEHSELLISFINNNINHPIAIGSLYNQDKTDPVQLQNTTQHILRAHPQAEFIIDDHHPALSFNYNQNKITLDNNLNITSSAENILMNAAKNMRYTSKQDTHETSENNYSRQINKNFNLNTQTGNIACHAGRNLIVQATQHIILNSNENINLKSNGLLNLHSSSDLSLLSTQKINITSQGNMTVHADSDLYIIAENSIQISQNGNSIEITKETITVTAPQVTVSGQPILSVKPTGPG